MGSYRDAIRHGMLTKLLAREVGGGLERPDSTKFGRKGHEYYGVAVVLKSKQTTETCMDLSMLIVFHCTMVTTPLWPHKLLLPCMTL